MNSPIIDPLQGGFPEVIETYLEHGIMKCISFNRHGTLLAAGCSDGSCVIWDFETRGIAKKLRNKNRCASVTSVCWSKSGHHILVSAADKSLTLWNVAKGKKVFSTTLQQTPLQARLHPSSGSQPPSLCLISSLSSTPFILDFHNKTTKSLPISFPAMSSTRYTSSAACFNKYGDLVYLGNSIGEILLIDHQKNKICGIFSISGGAAIKNIIFSRNGEYVLMNSSDRIIRIYKNLLPLKNSLNSLKSLKLNEIENLNDVGSKCLSFIREFQDSVTKVQFKAPCFSGDNIWVVGGSANKREHKVYIWDQAGLLVKILEGPNEALVDLGWHPVKPIVVSLSLTGLVYVWAQDYTESWSAFAPDFKELEENDEFVEREDEFDLMSETEKVKELGINEDDEVDITTVEKDSAFSDSDISQEELRFLPSDPFPDVLEKLQESSISGSPLSEGTGGVDGQAMIHDSSQPEVVENSVAEDTGVTRLKRRRKPSMKMLELLAFEATQETNKSDYSNTESVSARDCDESVAGFEQVNPLTHLESFHDVPEKLPESSNSGPLLSEGTGVNGQAVIHDSSQIEVVENSVAEDTRGTRLKRRRKPSMKMLELLAFEATQETNKSDYSNMESVSARDCDESMAEFEQVNTSTHLEPFPYVPEKLPESSNSGSPLSEGTGVLTQAMIHDSSQIEVVENSVAEDTGGTRLNRRRKPSMKLLELLAFEATLETNKSDYSYKECSSAQDRDASMTEFEEINHSNQGISNSGSPLSEGRVNGQTMIHDSSQIKVGEHSVAEDTGGTRLKRTRKPTLKMLELQAFEATQDHDEPITQFEKVNRSTLGMLRSMVWNHFKKVNNPNNKTVAVCNYCTKTLVAGPGNGTTNLRHHLKKKHAQLVLPANCKYEKRVLKTKNDDVSVMEYEEVNPSTRRKSKSEVWNYFKKFKKPNNEYVAVCNFCRVKFVSGDAGTNHLRNHLKRKHAEFVVSLGS